MMSSSNTPPSQIRTPSLQHSRQNHKKQSKNLLIKETRAECETGVINEDQAMKSADIIGMGMGVAEINPTGEDEIMLADYCENGPTQGGGGRGLASNSLAAGCSPSCVKSSHLVRQASELNKCPGLLAPQQQHEIIGQENDDDDDNQSS